MLKRNFQVPLSLNFIFQLTPSITSPTCTQKTAPIFVPHIPPSLFLILFFSTRTSRFQPCILIPEFLFVFSIAGIVL